MKLIQINEYLVPNKTKELQENNTKKIATEINNDNKETARLDLSKLTITNISIIFIIIEKNRNNIG